MEPWLEEQEKGCVLRLYIQPGASKDELQGVHGERLKVKIKAPPREGEANASVIEFMAKILGVSKSKVHFLRGESSRQKDLLVELPASEIIISLRELL
jgi:uncharacterized protein (TIGR00251 family)